MRWSLIWVMEGQNWLTVVQEASKLEAQGFGSSASSHSGWALFLSQFCTLHIIIHLTEQCYCFSFTDDQSKD